MSRSAICPWLDFSLFSVSRLDLLKANLPDSGSGFRFPVSVSGLDLLKANLPIPDSGSGFRFLVYGFWFGFPG